MYTAGYISTMHEDCIASHKDALPRHEACPVVKALKSEVKRVHQLNQPPEKSILQNVEGDLVKVASRFDQINPLKGIGS